MKPPMTDEEWLHWKDIVKCDWLHCAGGMGLAGNGCCAFRGDYDKADCAKFISEEEYEAKMKRLMD